MFKQFIGGKIVRHSIISLLIVLSFIPITLLTSPKAAITRPTKYYLVDRVLSNTDFAKLTSWGINAAVVDLSISANATTLNAKINAAAAVGIKTIIWPDQGGDVSGCGWETPFNSPQNGNYIQRVKSMLDIVGNNPNVLGIVTFHEPMWSSSSGCRDSIADLSAIYSQIHAYTGNPNFKVFGYINTLNTSTIKSGDGGSTGVADYTGPTDLAKIMDVAIIWQHCARGVEGPCEGSNSALSRINESRTLLNSVNSPVELVFLMQTFTTSGYNTKFTLSQLQTYSCNFLNTSALDGFGFYTWDTGWWSDLHSWTDLQPAVLYIHDNCTSMGISTIVPTITKSVTPTRTATRTRTPTRTTTRTFSYTVTKSPIVTISQTPTNTPVSCVTVWENAEVYLQVCNK